MRKRTLLLASLLIATAAGVWMAQVSSAGAADAPREELGAVDWHRDFDEAVEIAEEEGKPLFVLFTEVPGCSTVKGYGRRVLSNDLVAEAIEAEFVPVAVFNNVDGEDRAVLNSFGEPTWNNPAVRIIRPDRQPLTERLYGDYSVAATVRTMLDALKAADREPPAYLKLLARETRATHRQKTATFGMYCFWSGEAKLGRLPGVLQTRPGFLEGSEVVEVTYDPDATSLKQLARRAAKSDAATRFYARSRAEFKAAKTVFGEQTRRTRDDVRYSADDDNHALKNTPYRDLPMTNLQRTLVNSAVAAGDDPSVYLSPAQRQAAEQQGP